MKLIWKFTLYSLGVLSLCAAVGISYVAIVPPPLLQVGAGYSSKIVCSSKHLAGRDPSAVFAEDVLVADNPLLNWFVVDAEADSGLVRSAFLDFIAPMGAIQRPGLGCTSALGANVDLVSVITAPEAEQSSPGNALWPKGDRVEFEERQYLTAILNDEALAGIRARAIVVVKDGEIVAERYAHGFDADTRQLGWSMTKTITGALVGTVIDHGKLSLDQADLLPQWAEDNRSEITVRQLLSMESGLRFNESYGDVSDVNRMLFLEPDMADFAASSPLDHQPGSRFSYSSGSSVLLAWIWQNALGDRELAMSWPRAALFDPIGMKSAVLEADTTGTFVGGSYLYATPRDWARFGLLLMNSGNWNGQQVLSREYVDLMVTPTKTNPVYGQGHIWLHGKEDSDFEGNDPSYGVPEDAFWMRGHDGQFVAVVPSERLVVVRLGLTPNKLGYRPQYMVGELVKALRGD